MAVTYFQTSTDSDLTGPSGTGGTSRSLVASRSDGGSDTSLGTTNMNSNVFCNQNFFTESGDPGTDGTSTGTFTVVVRVATQNANIGIRVFLRRATGGDTGGTEVESAQGSQTAGAASRTFTWSNPGLGTWASGNRLRIRVQLTNTSGVMNQSCSIGVDSAADTIDTPFTAGPITVEGAANLVSTSSLFADATVTSPGTGAPWVQAEAWTQTQAWDHTGGATQQGEAALNSTSALTATGFHEQFAVTALTSTSSLTATALTPIEAAADLISAGYILIAIGTVTRLAAADLTAASALSVEAVTPLTQQGAANLTATSTLTATTAAVVQEATAALRSVSRLWTEPDIQTVTGGTPTLVRSHVETNNKTSSATNLSVTLDTPGVDAGNLLTAVIVFDNTSATAPTVTTIAKPGNEPATWARIASHNSPVSGAAAGVRSERWAIKTTVAWPGDTSYQITLSAAVVAKTCQPREFFGVSATVRGTAGFGLSTAGTPSATTSGTAPSAGDLLLGHAAFENRDAATQDTTNTLGGAWGAGTTFGTSGGSSVTNVQGITSAKVPTVGGHQTYAPTGTGDSGAAVVALVPALVTVWQRYGVAELTSASALTAVGTVIITHEATVNLVSTSTLGAPGEAYGPQGPSEQSAEPGYAVPGAFLPGSAYTAPAQGGGAVVEAGANLTTDDADLSVTAMQIHAAAAALGSTSTIAVPATLERFGVLALTTEAFVDVDAHAVLDASAALASSSSLAATAAAGAGVNADLTATSSLTATAARTTFAATSLTAASGLVAAAVRTVPAAAAFTTASTLTATGTSGADVTAALISASSLTSTAQRTAVTGAALTTTSSLTATATAEAGITANLTSASSLVGTAIRATSATATLTAGSTLTTTGIIGERKTPAERIYVVPAETRTHIAPAHSRTLVVT